MAQQHERHCKDCPHNTYPDKDNPNVCHWVRTGKMSFNRMSVVSIIEKMMQNNPHPWCQFPLHFRMIVVRSALRATMSEYEHRRVAKVIPLHLVAAKSDVGQAGTG